MNNVDVGYERDRCRWQWQAACYGYLSVTSLLPGLYAVGGGGYQHTRWPGRLLSRLHVITTLIRA